MSADLTPAMAAHVEALTQAILDLNYPVGPIVNSISDRLARTIADAVMAVPHPELARLRGIERGWQHDRAEWAGERDKARAERDALRAVLDKARHIAGSGYGDVSDAWDDLYALLGGDV